MAGLFFTCPAMFKVTFPFGVLEAQPSICWCLEEREERPEFSDTD